MTKRKPGLYRHDCGLRLWVCWYGKGLPVYYKSRKQADWHMEDLHHCPRCEGYLPVSRLFDTEFKEEQSG